MYTYANIQNNVYPHIFIYLCICTFINIYIQGIKNSSKQMEPWLISLRVLRTTKNPHESKDWDFK